MQITPESMKSSRFALHCVGTQNAKKNISSCSSIMLSVFSWPAIPNQVNYISAGLRILSQKRIRILV